MMRARFLAVCFLLLPLLLRANPEGASIVSGHAKIERLDGQTTQILTGEKAIIEWQDFSIGVGEKTVFMQPHKNAAVLNRVTGNRASFILGSLEANGRVYLINQNGLLIGRQGVISAASFVGSTHPISNDDFLRDATLVFKGDGEERLINQGEIHAREGDIMLLGYEVESQGLLSALKGEVLIGSAKEIIITPSGDERMRIRLSSPDAQTETGIELGGTIQALRAHVQADGNLYALAINQTGIVQATGAVEKDGKIFLVTPGGSVQVHGQISAKNEKMSGGEVRILGENVSLLESAAIDVSGAFGGGVVLVGGDREGKNPEILNSEYTHVARGACIDASATENGDGGKVIVWGNEATSFAGTILARGGDEGGDGGFVEVSGKYLGYRGIADRSAPKGKAGMLLLDPFNVTISAAATANETLDTGTYSPTASGANIKNSDLQTNLGGGPITVVTGNFGAEAGNITITAAVSYTSTNALTLQAAGNIALNNTGSIVNAGAGAITFTAGGNIVIDGNLQTTTSADIALNAGGNITIASAGSSTIIARNFTAIANGNFTSGASLAAGINVAGAITLVIDNANPSAPNIGGATLFMGNFTNFSSTSPSNGSIFVYTARESQNTVLGGAQLNGAAYVAPTAAEFAVNTDRAQWSTYYPSGFTPAAPTTYTFFFKETGPTVAQVVVAMTVLTTISGGSQSTAVTTGAPTQISTFQQPLNQPSVPVAISTYSSGFYVGPIQRPAVSATACP
jgi:filamentous hemagglutinin family protein